MFPSSNASCSTPISVGHLAISISFSPPLQISSVHMILGFVSRERECVCVCFHDARCCISAVYVIWSHYSIVGRLVVFVHRSIPHSLIVYVYGCMCATADIIPCVATYFVQIIIPLFIFSVTFIFNAFTFAGNTWLWCTVFLPLSLQSLYFSLLFLYFKMKCYIECIWIVLYSCTKDIILILNHLFLECREHAFVFSPLRWTMATTRSLVTAMRRFQSISLARSRTLSFTRTAFYIYFANIFISLFPFKPMRSTWKIASSNVRVKIFRIHSAKHQNGKQWMSKSSLQFS